MRMKYTCYIPKCLQLWMQCLHASVDRSLSASRLRWSWSKTGMQRQLMLRACSRTLRLHFARLCTRYQSNVAYYAENVKTVLNAYLLWCIWFSYLRKDSIAFCELAWNFSFQLWNSSASWSNRSACCSNFVCLSSSSKILHIRWHEIFFATIVSTPVVLVRELSWRFVETLHQN